MALQHLTPCLSDTLLFPASTHCCLWSDLCNVASLKPGSLTLDTLSCSAGSRCCPCSKIHQSGSALLHQIRPLHSSSTILDVLLFSAGSHCCPCSPLSSKWVSSSPPDQTPPMVSTLLQYLTCCCSAQAVAAVLGAHFHQSGSALLHQVGPLPCSLHRGAGQAAGPGAGLCPCQGQGHHRSRAGGPSSAAVSQLPGAAYCSCQPWTGTNHVVVPMRLMHCDHAVQFATEADRKITSEQMTSTS